MQIVAHRKHGTRMRRFYMAGIRVTCAFAVAAVFLLAAADGFTARKSPGYYGTPLHFPPPPVDLGPGIADPGREQYAPPPRSKPARPEPQVRPVPSGRKNTGPALPAKTGSPRGEDPVRRPENDASPYIEGERQERREEAGQRRGRDAASQEERAGSPDALPRRTFAEEPDLPEQEAGDAETPATGNAEQLSRSQAGTARPRGKSRLRLFGTVEFRGFVRELPKWSRVLQAERKAPSFIPEGLACRKTEIQPRWLKMKQSLRDASLMEKAKKVNVFFNQWPYKTDIRLWKVEDFWATPCEFMARSGDCEDYAIAKYYALRDLGVPAHSMRIAAVWNSISGIGHAVLVLYVGDDAYVLDNMTNLVLSHTRLSHYRLRFTANEEGIWRHVKPLSGPRR